MNLNQLAIVFILTCLGAVYIIIRRYTRQRKDTHYVLFHREGTRKLKLIVSRSEYHFNYGRYKSYAIIFTGSRKECANYINKTQ